MRVADKSFNQFFYHNNHRLLRYNITYCKYFFNCFFANKDTFRSNNDLYFPFTK